MLKRTIVLQSAGYVSLELNQLCFSDKQGNKKKVPIEDIGTVIFDSRAQTVSVPLLSQLAESNVCTIFCNEKHFPFSSLLPLTGNSLSQKTISAQIASSQAMRDRLWKQTIFAKIINQAKCLEKGGKEGAVLLKNLSKKVRNGDPENVEGTAARVYFKSHSIDTSFTRNPNGDMPNPALNYGYAIVRAAIARALISSGLLPVIGIHHHSQYNEYCLADDIMEPYRPFVDDVVFNTPTALLFKGETVTQSMKQILLSLIASDVMIHGTKKPMASAMSQTTASLARCFLKEENEIVFPEFLQ